MRKIAVISSSRADYGHLYWPLRELSSHSEIDLKLIVMGPHLSPEFGTTVKQIEEDGFVIDAKIECLLSSDTDVGMAKTIGLATLSLADTLGRMRPDVVLLTADRYEMLAPASVAVALRIPIAHIEGGEISEGAIDDAIRNALTKLSHIHFTSTEAARERVVGMGEEPWRVHTAGSPSLDHLRRSKLMGKEQLGSQLSVNLGEPFAMAGYHPATLAQNTTRDAEAFFQAMAGVPHAVFFCYPNVDAGSRELIRRAEEFVSSRTNAKIFVNLGPVLYWSLLQHAEVLIGNSSSGIMEAASFAIPVVNVGDRQKGREKGRNVLDAAADAASILDRVQQACDPAWRATLSGMTNLYGDGHAAEKIVSVLASAPLGNKLLIKKASG